MTKKKDTLQAKKATYRIRNWSDYNQSLVKRGSITLWIDEEVLANWHPQPAGKRKRGGQVQYSDQAIEALLMLKAGYGLPYRQTIGFAQSILSLLEADVRVPDYSLLCKRSQDVTVSLSTRPSDEPKHIVLDSTGLKVYGEGEWKGRQYGYSKRRTWRKLHLSVDENTQELQAVVLTEASVDDAEAGKTLLDETPGDIERVGGDGAYDRRKFYEASVARGIPTLLVPPQRHAKIWQHGNTQKAPLARDENLRRIRKVGRQQWKKESGYHRRSLAETAVFRFKMIFGNTLSSRTPERQITEARVKASALNRMTQLGMPDSYPLA